MVELIFYWAYRLKSNLDVGMRLFYELGATLGTHRRYDHTHKVIGTWVEYNRWVAEVQYGGVWNLSKDVYPTRKFRSSLRWFTSENRKFFLGLNYEKLTSDSEESITSITYDGVFYLPTKNRRVISQQSVQIVGGIMF